MADATEIRSDNTSAEPPADPPAAETVAAPSAVETEAAAPAAAAIVAAPEAVKTIETPAITAADAVAPPARASLLAGWLARLRGGLAAATPTRPALLAAGIGFVAGAGLLLAAVSFMGMSHLGAMARPAAAPWKTTADETRAVKRTVAKLETQVAELKTSVDAASRSANAQRNQIADRDQRNARTQGEVQARLVKIADSLERLEKRVAAAVAADSTGSVAPNYAAAAAGTGATGTGAGSGAAAAQPAATEAKAPPAAPAPPKLAAVDGWAIRDVFRGRALVVSRRGVYEAAPGLHLPDLGRVEAVTRENGRWVVVTEKGVITAHRRSRSPYDAN